MKSPAQIEFQGTKNRIAGRYPQRLTPGRASRRAGQSSVCGRSSFTREKWATWHMIEAWEFRRAEYKKISATAEFGALSSAQCIGLMLRAFGPLHSRA